MNKPYSSDENINEQLIRYINRNVPIYDFFGIRGFKVGGQEACTQNCLVSITHPKDNVNNQYIGIAWFAQIFEENIKIRDEKNTLLNKLKKLTEDVFNIQDEYGNKCVSVDRIKEILSDEKGR